MIKNVLLTMAKKWLYALCGVLALFLLEQIPNFHPTNPVQSMIWIGLGVPILTAIAAGLKRIASYDPNKDPKAVK